MTFNALRPLAASAFAAAVIFVQPAFAAPAPGTFVETRSKVVNIDDLDLATVEGQAKLDARLRRAAGAVCDIATGPHSLADRSLEMRCFNDALASARESYAMARSRPVMSR